MMALILKPRGCKERASAPAPKITHMDLSYLQYVSNVSVQPLTSGDFPIAIMSTCAIFKLKTYIGHVYDIRDPHIIIGRYIIFNIFHFIVVVVTESFVLAGDGARPQIPLSDVPILLLFFFTSLAATVTAGAPKRSLVIRSSAPTEYYCTLGCDANNAITDDNRGVQNVGSFYEE